LLKPLEQDVKGNSLLKFQSGSVPPQTKIPQLLVSVRNGAEAQAALEGGCDILDVKEPANGSLGMADSVSIREVVDTASRAAGKPQVSAACGEVREWLAGLESPVLPAGLEFTKLGCAGLAGTADWRAVWRQVRRRIRQTSLGSPGWIAVAYADWRAAEAPAPDAMIEAAVEEGCRGVLFDTFLKDGRGLLDWISAAELERWAEQIHGHGLMLALAGSLGREDLPALSGIPAEIVAIRTAACRHGERAGTIDAEAVRDFRAELRRAWL
jgi:hypothetical protein